MVHMDADTHDEQDHNSSAESLLGVQWIAVKLWLRLE